jgi:hypothetical protein
LLQVIPINKKSRWDKRQDYKGNFKRVGFKGKKNMKAMQTNMWDHESNEGEGEDSEVEADETNKLFMLS